MKLLVESLLLCESENKHFCHLFILLTFIYYLYINGVWNLTSQTSTNQSITFNKQNKRWILDLETELYYKSVNLSLHRLKLCTVLFLSHLLSQTASSKIQIQNIILHLRHLRTVQAVIRLTGQALALLIILRENWLASSQISWEEEADDHLGQSKEMKAPSPILIQQKNTMANNYLRPRNKHVLLSTVCHNWHVVNNRLGWMDAQNSTGK